MLIRPIALLWNVQMNRNTKISVGGILGLGILYDEALELYVLD